MDMYDMNMVIMIYLSNNITTPKDLEMIKNMVNASGGELSPVEFLEYKKKDNTWQDAILKVCDNWGTANYEDFIDYMRAEGADCFYTED